MEFDKTKKRDSESPAKEVVSGSISEDLQSGTLLDERYCIESVISEGAMGRIYRARQVDMDRPVAIKFLHGHLLRNQEGIERFKREAVVCAALDHPGILRVYASGVMPNGEPFIVMDLLEGHSLASELSRGKVAGERFAKLFLELMEALKYAHGRGIIHRDIKPSNIFLTDAGSEKEKAVLIDFGIAKVVADSADQKLTQTGAVIGTTAYMSPEQCCGAAVDLRSDIYSLGCVMYECLSGSTVFNGESQFEVMYQHLHKSLSELTLLKRMPRGMGELLARCLAKNPNDRFQTVDELQKSFVKASVAAKTVEARRRRLPGIAMGVGLLIVVGGGVGFGITYFERAESQRRAKLAKDFPAVASPKEKRELRSTSEPVPRGVNAMRRDVDALILDHQQTEALTRLEMWLDLYGKKGSAKDKIEIWQLAAVCAMQLALPERAQTYLTKAIDSSDGSVPRNTIASLYFDRARSFQFQRRFDKAFVDIEKALSLADGLNRNLNAEVLDAAGGISRQRGDFQAAFRYYSKERESLMQRGRWLSPHSIACRRGLAACEFAKGNQAEAEKILVEAHDLAKTSSSRHRDYEHLAAEYSRMGKPEKAAAAYEESLDEIEKMAPKVLPDRTRELARIFNDLGRSDIALRRLHKLRQQELVAEGGLGPEGVKTSTAILSALIAANQWDKVVEESEKLLNAGAQIDGTTLSQALVVRCSVPLREGKTGEVLALVNKWQGISKSPIYLCNAAKLKGEAQYQNSNWQLALTAYKQSIEALDSWKPTNLVEKGYKSMLIGDSYHKMGRCAEARAEVPEAISFYKRSLSAYEDAPSPPEKRLESLLLLAQLEHLSSNYDTALDYDHKAIALAGNVVESSEVRCQLARDLAAAGMFEKALASAERAIKDANNASPPDKARKQSLKATFAKVKVLTAAGRRDEAVKLLNELAAEWRRDGDLQGEASCYQTLSDVHRERHDPPAAELALRKAIDLDAKMNRVSNKLRLQVALARTLEQQRRQEEAEKLLRGAIAESAGDSREDVVLAAIQVRGTLAEILARQGKRAEAEDLYLQATVMSQKENNPWNEGVIILSHAKSLAYWKDYPRSLELYEKAATLLAGADQLSNRTYARRLIEEGITLAGRQGLVREKERLVQLLKKSG